MKLAQSASDRHLVAIDREQLAKEVKDLRENSDHSDLIADLRIKNL